MSENNKYTQKENENFLQYAKRLIEKRQSGEYDIDKAEVYELLTGEQVGGDHARKVLCFLEKILDKVETDNINMSEGELLEALKKERIEIQKEKQKARDEKNEYRQLVREQSRTELFGERIDEAVDKLLNKKQRNIPITKTLTVNNEVDLLVAFADAHYDSEFEIKGFNGEILNKYNRNVFEDRMWKLRDEIVEFSKLHRVNTLHVIDGGDILEGIIRVASLQSVKNSPMESILDYIDFIEDWLHDLTIHGFIVNFYTSLGNHSTLRILNGEIHENLECIYNRFLQKLFLGKENITIHNNNQGMNYFDVQGFKCFSVHGQDDKSPKRSIKDYEEVYGIKINYLITGHMHNKQESEVFKGKETIQVRSIMGINEYATKIKKTAEAGATMFTIHKNYGRKYVNDVKFR
jgi:hypothetical protein